MGERKVKNIETTSRYRKQFKKIKRMTNADVIIRKLELVLEKLRSRERLENQYRDHGLCNNGSFQGQRECHLAGDILLVYINEENRIILSQIGTHTNIYDQSRKRAVVNR